ncbi:hypothetical protein [Flavobacterium mesophilum]|uniref:hypothetical protein n=1 Tax=Flavobacterium mesophilum TaxID=3143495 RepID=UPI0031D22A64
MKQLFTLVFSFLSLCICAQQKDDHKIKIYLEDAETGKNIDDAKVTLEGFEIPAITGQYDKKAKFYYFDKIPAGYNTIMAYHKKYNEKGFQNVSGLPGELKLRLYDPLNVSYDFESDTYKNRDQNIYVEDSYKIGVFSTDIEDYNIFKDYIYTQINKLNLQIELVNPYFELENDKNIPFLFRSNSLDQKEDYPYIKDFNAFTNDFIIPLKEGYSSTEYNFTSNHVGTINAKKIVFYIRKKDGSKFKRFNDPYIKKITNIKGILISSVIYNKFYFRKEKTNKSYKNSLTKKLDKNNRFSNIDSSKVFFYYNFKNAEIRKIPEYDRLGMTTNAYSPIQNEILVYHLPSISSFLIKNLQFENIESTSCTKEVFDLDKSIGLGILDQYELISQCLNQKFLISDIKNNY